MHSRNRLGRAAIAVLAVVALAVSCSSDAGGSNDQGATDGAGSTEAEEPTAASDPAVVEFEGSVDEFYEVPEDLPAGEPGDLIRTMPVEAPAGEAGLRIMYRSTDAEGDERVVTGVVYHPTEEPPEGGWPIVAWAHGTTGLAASCAPSRGPSGSPGFGVKGVRVATDYIGLGPVGELHPYLSAAAEGNAVIDGVDAVRAVPEANAGDEWVVVGVSQGGHAALVSNEMAADRLPDAELLGAVALAPGAQLGETYGDELQARIITTMVLVGVAAEDPTVDLADYLSPDALAASSVIEEGCMGDIIGEMPAAAAAPDYWVTDPRTAPVGEVWLEENDPGQVAAESPLLLVQGGKDILVLPARTDSLFARLCDLGQVVERLDVAEADHDTVVDLSEDDVSAWVAARFAGEPPTDDC